MTLFTWAWSSAAGPWSGISLLNLVPASIKYDPIPINFHLWLPHVTFFPVAMDANLPSASSSKPDRASGCLSSDFGVKIISCKGKKEDADWVTDKQQLYSIIHVFIRGLEKTPEIRAFISFHAHLLSPYNTQHWRWRKHLLPKLNESNFFRLIRPDPEVQIQLKKQNKKTNKPFYPPLAPSLICSGTNFLMPGEALHLYATGDHLRHSLWLKTVWV